VENAEGKNTNTSEQTITPAPDTAQPEGGNGVNAQAGAAAETSAQAPEQASGQASDQAAGQASGQPAAGADAAAAMPDDDAPEELSPELIAAMDQARAAEADGPDKAAEAWRAVIARDPSRRAPWRELARVLRAAEKWRPLSDALKDEEQQAARSRTAKSEVLRELAAIYRDNLRNEQQAIATLTRIVEVDPKRLEVYDELAAFYDSKKRWPDLVATLTKKAENLPDPDDQVALYLQIANLYIERFSNQAEAIKAFERVLDVDPNNQAAITHLLDVYEKRRDWEKLIGLREKQIETIADPNERAEKTYEVAKLAATRVKKPEVCVHWWEKVLVDDPGHEEAMTELYKLYERNKSWDKLADICEKQAAIAPDEKTQADALQKLGLLYTEKVEDNAKAIHAWRRLLLLDDQNRRAQDALKKLYITTKDWDALEEFYRSQDKIEEYVRVIERQVEAGDEEDRLPLAMKIAVLYRDELDKADRAMRAFEKVLSLDENNLEAAEALIPLYADGRDPRKLVRVLEIQLAQTQDPELRIERTKRLAEYNEEKLRDKAAAFGWYLKAHAEDHRAAWIRTELERLAAEIGTWAELVEAYQASYAKFDDASEALPLMAVVARVQETELGEIDKALETNRAILVIDEANEGAISALERLYLGKERYEDLLDIYKRKLELTFDGDLRTEIQFKIGQLYEDEVKDDEKAVEAYKEILAAIGDDPRALGALDRIYLRNQRYEDLAETLEQQIAIVGPDDNQAQHLELKYRLGQVREKHLDDVPGAIACYSDILMLEPAHAGAREALEARLSDDAHKLEAAGILEPIYEQLESWADLVRVHEIQLAAEKDALRRVSLLMRIGELHAKKLADAEKAFDAYARCFREDPATEGAKAELEELCALLDDGWTRLVGLFEEALGREDIDPLLAHELATKVARAYEERLDKRDKAVEFYRRALQIDPDDENALDALERIFTSGEQFAELLDVFRRKADIATDDKARLDMLVRIAAIHEEVLQNPEDAISTYNEILGQDPDNLMALRALDRLYLAGEQWQDLGDTLTRQLTLAADEDEQVLLLVRLAQLRETHLEELAAAIETYRQVLDLQSQNPDAVTALERLIASPDHELTIAQILEPIYQATGNWERQIGVYEIMARHAFDPERKIALLHQIAELYEIGGERLDDAFDTYARAFREEPRSERTQGQLDRLAQTLDRWADLVRLYDSVIENLSDDDLKVQLLTKLAKVYEIEIGNDENAVATYERILKVAPEHVDSATAIQLIHERNAAYPALVAILKRKSEIIVDLPERKDLLYKAAHLQEDVLEDLDAAIATYQAVLELDDIDMPAMNALERLYIRLERWEKLKDVYAKKAELAEHPDDKKQMLHVLGQVYDHELGDVAKAIETYQAILDIDPDELPAIQQLDRLFTAAERWYDLLQNLERQVELAETMAEVVGLKYRIGQLWQHKLQDLARAIDSYREALEIDAAHHETLAALDGILHSKEGEPVMAARVLEPIYEAGGEFEKLVDVLEVMVAHSEDPDQRVELLHRIAGLLEHQLAQVEGAFRAHSRALREDSGNETTLENLPRLAAATGSWRELAQLYAAEADKSLDVPRQVDLLSRLARVQEQELDQSEQAIATYKRILEVDFENREAIYALDRLYSASQRWNELAEILRKEIQLAGSDEEIVDLQFRLGQVLEQRLGDLSGAIEVYRDILGTNDGHGPTLDALEMLFLEGHHQMEIAGILEPLYEAAAEYEKLHKIYEVQLGMLAEAGERQSMYQRLAELAEDRLADPRRAFHWWGEATVEDPRWEQSVEESERLAQATAAWAQMGEVYRRVLDRHRDDADVRRQTLLRLARVYEFELGQSDDAIKSHLQVLAIDNQDVDALRSLDRLYEAAGMYEQLVDILRRRIAVTIDGDEIIELHFRRGHIYSDALNDLDAALRCYEAVLEQESRNRTALAASERIFFRREDWQRLYEVYEKLVDVAENDAEMSDIYAHMARLSSEALDREDQKNDAIELWERVLDIRGDEPQALGALAELYARRQKWQELVEIIERQVQVAPTGREKIVFYKRLGRIWAEKLESDHNALDAWLRADDLDRRDLETLRALAHLYETLQSWEELSTVLGRIVDVGQEQEAITEEEMIALYARIGEIEGDILGRVDLAVDAWSKVVALDPSDFRALDALEKLFTREARWEECIDVLQKRALILDDEQQRVDTLLQAAAIWEEKVENLDEAAVIYARVHEAEPANERASERLEAIYRAKHEWGPLNEVLLARADLSQDPQEKIDIFGQMAKIYEEELSDPESAFVVLQAAFREDYAHERTARELERLAESTHKWEELLTEYTQLVQSLEGSQPDSAADLWVKIGRWYGDHLSHLDYAIHSVERALRLDPNHLGALGALADFQRIRQSWPELIETLRKHAAVETDTAKKVELYLSLAELLENQMQVPMEAIAAYRSALQADKGCMEALDALERLYRQHEMWEQLIDVLGRIADLRQEEGEIIRLKLEIGDLWDVRMLDAGRAIAAYRDVLEIDGTNLPALRALEQLYEKTGQSEEYLSILEAQLDVSPTDAERISLYERMASAWEERFGKLDRAAECLEKIVAIDERNYHAYRELSRLYRQDQKWDSLIDTYRNHIMAANDPVTRIDLYCSMGEVYDRHLNDPDRAIEAYKDALTFDPEESRALDALGRLYERIGEWDQANDAMGQLVQITDSPAKQVELYHRMGRIMATQLRDQEQAEDYFLRALSIEATHVPTMEDLVGLYSERGDWLKAAQMMVRAESHTASIREKIRLLYEAARIYLEKLHDRQQAKAYLAAVIALDPEHVGAAEPLSNIYFDAKEWQPLSPILDMLVRKAQQDQADAQRLNELYYRTARVADELEESDKALQFYEAAYGIDPTYLPTLMGRADLLFKLASWEEAGRIYQTILVQHRDALSEDDVVRIYFRMGMVRQRLGERKKALNMFEKALEIDPTHRDTLEAVIAIQEEQGDFEAVIHAKRGLMASGQDTERVALLNEIGDIYHQKLQNPQKAISAYLEALDIEPEDHQLLQKVLDLYTETKQWRLAVDTIERFVSLEANPVYKGSYYHAAGSICRRELKDLGEAISYYNRALDCFFAGDGELPESALKRAFESFEYIDKILTSQRDWKEQERAYRQMIKRLQGKLPGSPIHVTLWHALGEIYRSRLKHFQSAISAFEIAQQLEPGNFERREILVELYLTSGPEYNDKAIEQHMLMLRENPFKYDSYKALRRIYMDTHQYDKAWCVCNTLAFLKQADPEEMQFYEQYKPRGFVKAKQAPMNSEVWRNIIHPDENRYISAILAAVWEGPVMKYARPAKAFGLKPKDRRQLANDQLMFSRIFSYIAETMGVMPMPDVYVQENQPGEISLANVLDKTRLVPSFVVGKNLLAGRPEKEVAFVAARKLCLVRPEHYLRLALQTNTERKVALLAAIAMVTPNFPVPPELLPYVQQEIGQIQGRVAPVVLEQLARLVRDFMQKAPEVDLGKWEHAVDATSYRVGFILCGDLDVAARMVSAEPVVVGGPQVKDKVKELVLYSVSESYFAVRQQLGLTIG
jgi:tetratricopeptide (TPR) repeat protein